jgi:excisionase family DNA binding protein
MLYFESRRDADVRLLTVKEAAEMLSLSERTIQRYLKSGELSCVRLGRSVRIELKDLEEFVEKKKQD